MSYGMLQSLEPCSIEVQQQGFLWIQPHSSAAGR